MNEVIQAVEALFPTNTSHDKCVEILQATSDGDNLDPSDLALIENIVNRRSSHPEQERFDALYDSVKSGAYGKRWLFGIENLTRDSRGFVSWRGKRIDHYSTPGSLKQREEMKWRTERRAAVLLGLERLGLPVNDTNASKLMSQIRNGDVVCTGHTPPRSPGGRFIFYWVPLHLSEQGIRSKYVAIGNDESFPQNCARRMLASGDFTQEPGQGVDLFWREVASKESLDELISCISNEAGWAASSTPRRYSEIIGQRDELLSHLDRALTLSSAKDQPTELQLFSEFRSRLGLPLIEPNDFFGVTKNFPDFEKFDERPEILPDQFVERARKLLEQALPLAEIPFANDAIGKKIRQRLAEPSEDPRDYMFLMQDAWPYVHSGANQVVPDSRRALQQEFSVLLRSDLVEDSSPQVSEAPVG